DDSGRVRFRFVSFLKTFTTVSEYDSTTRRSPTEEEADAIYRFRNSLMHSFGLYFEIQGVPIHHFVFQSSSPGPAVSMRDNGWHLSIYDFFEAFTIAVETYRSRLLESANLQANFERMYPKYATLFLHSVNRL